MWLDNWAKENHEPQLLDGRKIILLYNWSVHIIHYKELEKINDTLLILDY